MTFNQEAQRSIQQFGKLGVNLKRLCFAPKLKHQLCWHSSFLRPRCHEFLNFCNLWNNLNIITPFTLTWIFKFIIKIFQVGGFAAPPPSLLSSLPSHMLLHLEKVIWQIQSGRFNWKHLLNLTPLLHPLQKFRKTSGNFYHAAYLVKVWSQNAKPLFEVEARWWWLSSFDQQPLSDINRLKDYETPSKVSSQHIFWPKKAPLIYFRQLMRNKWTLSLIIRS